MVGLGCAERNAGGDGQRKQVTGLLCPPLPLSARGSRARGKQAELLVARSAHLLELRHLQGPLGGLDAINISLGLQARRRNTSHHQHRGGPLPVPDGCTRQLMRW